MSVDGAVASSTSQVLALTEGNMFAFGVLEALRKAKIDDIHVVLGGFSATHEEVVRLDIAMDNAFLVDLLDTLVHLHSNVYI